MNVFGVGATGAPDLGSIASGGAVENGDGSGGFSQILDGLNEAALAADDAVTDVAVGGDADLHDVTLAVELESLAFDLAVQIRNRLVDAYQEVFRMQI
jgi:flagellar hook-basal body complex protein FliE